MALPSRCVKGFHQEFVVNARLVGHPQVNAADEGAPRIEYHFRIFGDRDTGHQPAHKAVGFSDQSHLARHFRRLTGMPPSLARWRSEELRREGG